MRGFHRNDLAAKQVAGTYGSAPARAFDGVCRICEARRKRPAVASHSEFHSQATFRGKLPISEKGLGISRALLEFKG